MYPKSIILSLVFLVGAFVALGVTAAESHVSEHILIAAAIGYGTLVWLIPLERTYNIYISSFVIAWWSGTMFYLGREVRDYEKDTETFDWGGFLGPALGNIVTFAVSYGLYQSWQKHKGNQKMDTMSPNVENKGLLF